MNSLSDVKLSDFARQKTKYTRHMPELDGLRGIAIITVVWHNVSAGSYGNSGAFSSIVNLLVNSGWMGVQLFFVLSGFLITGLLLDERGQPHNLRNFFMRRLLRIFPLYYLVLGVSLLVVVFTGWDQYWSKGYREYGVWYWTYLTNWISVSGHIEAFQHFWSLAVEEQYYLLWPICVLMLGTKSLLRLCVVLVLSALLFRTLIWELAPEIAHKAAYQFTCARWDALIIGGIGAVLLRHSELQKRIRTVSLVSVLLAIAYFMLYVVLYHNFAPAEAGMGALNQTFCAIGCGGWLLLSISPAKARLGHWNRQLLQFPWLRLVGKYSYAIYIFHFPVKIISAPMWLTYKAQYDFLNSTVQAIIIFAISYIMALVSWQLIEKPILGWKKHFYSSASQIPTGMEAGKEALNAR